MRDLRLGLVVTCLIFVLVSTSCDYGTKDGVDYSAQSHLNYGVVLHRDGDLHGAEQLYRHTFFLNPQNPYSIYNIGVIKMGQGRNDEAAMYFLAALNVRPGLPEAEQNLRALASANPSPDAAATFIKGVVYEKEGENLEAEIAYRAALTLDPSSADAASGLARLVDAKSPGSPSPLSYALMVLLAAGALLLIGWAIRRVTAGRRERLILAVVVLAGSTARLLLPLRGHNEDFDAFRLMAHIVESGDNIYLSPVYHYGPVLFSTLTSLDFLVHHDVALFRVGLVSLLTLAEIGITLLLFRRFGLLAASLYFLNPVSIITTGYHNQFDILAVSIAFLGIAAYESGSERGRYGGLALIGLSLATKQIFFLLPVWLAAKGVSSFIRHDAGADIRKAALDLVLPPAIFIASLLPFWPAGHYGIVHYVFGYKSANNAPFWHTLWPEGLHFVSPTLLWMGALVVAALFVYRMTPMVRTLLYAWLFVALSPAIANQYFTIAMPAVAVFWNPLLAIFTLVTTLYLAADFRELHIQWVADLLPRRLLFTSVGVRAYDPMVVLLVAGLAFHVVKMHWTGLVSAAKEMWSAPSDG